MNCSIIKSGTATEESTLQDQMSAIDALLYKSYKVLLLSKVRSKIEVNLGKCFINLLYLLLVILVITSLLEFHL